MTPRPLIRTPALIAVAIAGVFVLSVCNQTDRPEAPNRPPVQRTSMMLPAGSYDVQSAGYNDGTGMYRVMVLGAPAGVRPFVETDRLRMARIEDSDLAKGRKSFLVVGTDDPVLMLTPDFSIHYTHHVTEERVNPSTGTSEVVVVRQESSVWMPFVAGMAGAALGNAVFAPAYYLPPVYSSQGLRGVGASGKSPAVAHDTYVQKHGTPPPAARLSKAGVSFPPGPARQDGLRPSGAGAGSSKLDTGPAKPRPTRGKAFGSVRRR